MKIIVGVDGSEQSGRAVEWCARHAHALGAEITAVHAINLAVVVSPMSSYVPVPQFTDIDLDQLRKVVTNKWCAALTEAKIPFEVVLKETDPALAIMEVANTENADLVVTGRRGRGGFAELVLGSTTYALTHHLNRPLVIVP
ncbi:MAG: universal stress protein [Acidimicrobiia bacterium]